MLCYLLHPSIPLFAYREVRAFARKIWIVIGIAFEHFSPSFAHDLALWRLEPASAAAGRFVMTEFGKWRIDNQIPGVPKLETEIHVIERHRQLLFVETADLHENITPGKQASAGHAAVI